MNQKSFASIILVVVIVLLVGAVGYFALVKKPPSVTQQIIPPPQQQTPSQPSLQNKSSNSGLTITSVIPSTVGIDSTITIHGSGFSIPSSVRSMGMENIFPDAVVILENANGQQIPIFSLAQGKIHSDNTLTFTLPSRVCKYSQRGCAPSDPSSYYYDISPGQYRIFIQIYGDPKLVSNKLSVAITMHISASTVSVPGMSKYTDTDFGFSFWYPSGWMVQQESVADVNAYSGGTITKQLSVSSALHSDHKVIIQEYNSPTRSITDSISNFVWGGSISGPFAVQYYFDTSTHTWMASYPYGQQVGLKRLPPGAAEPAHVAWNTMGGLHILTGAGQDLIVPLSAQHFLIVSASPNFNTSRLVSTIIATDSSVATPVSIDDQNAAIVEELSEYAGQ